MIKMENGEWCVYRHEGENLVKVRCYPSEKEAEAAKEKLIAADSYTAAYNLDLNGVEIFATGVHNGDKYDEQDLDDMVAAFQRLDFQPPLKSGHSKDEPGMPSLGYVANLRRQGQKLVADFTHMPQVVYDYIKDRRFDRVSAEVYWNLKRGKDSFRRALKAVALLGADIPAVAGLRPLHELFSAEADVKLAEAVQLFSSKDEGASHGGNMTEQEIKALQDKHAAEIAERDKQIQALTGQFAEMNKKFEQLSATTGSIDDARRNAEVAEAKARADAAEKARKAAETAAKVAKDAQEASEARERENAERLAALEADAKRNRIRELVASIKIPAFRPFVAQYADMASRVPGGETKVYVEDVNGGKVAALDQLTDLVKLLNNAGGNLLKVYSQNDKPELAEDSADKEVDRLAKKYAQDNKVDYATAVQRVLNDNPALKEAYVHRKPAAA